MRHKTLEQYAIVDVLMLQKTPRLPRHAHTQDGMKNDWPAEAVAEAVHKAVQKHRPEVVSTNLN